MMYAQVAKDEERRRRVVEMSESSLAQSFRHGMELGMDLGTNLFEMSLVGNYLLL